ncbi:MAG: F0F1 ATP synthase subunit delta [Alphaproteobacteria bacterium]|nr:F0F1 ATP synthase subunit delta [Alphaproteobacteria bacterium]MBL6936342.1 F0F1 ATP synthase subunit delta [Alphaproteobacteria bacterium]MBL7098607.1 F0F1 ATP synthase subunit delta [Alphaproteobacteria bacterium]
MATENTREQGLAGRYATAVFELADETRSLPALEKDLQSLKAALRASKDLSHLVRSPVFSEADQARAMKAVLAQMGAGDLATKFVLTLAAKRRLFALSDIIASFENILARHRGEIQAEVTSARALNDSELAELKATLKSRLGRDPRLDAKVDPSLLGGLVVKVGSRMIDSSLRTKLTGLRAAMRGN